MNSIKVKKIDLIAAMEKNRAEHRAAFIKAQDAYRATVIKVLDEELQAAKHGRPFVLARITALVQPSDHTNDYERIIGMLNMDTGDIVELNQQEYKCYVEDDWGWMGQFANEVSNYGVSSAKLARYATNQ
jgi:hypothetical protein